MNLETCLQMLRPLSSDYLIASFIRFISHSKLEDNIGKFGFILIKIEFNRASSLLILSC